MIRRYYTAFKPEKLAEWPALCVRYCGEEAAWREILVGRHGVFPDDPFASADERREAAAREVERWPRARDAPAPSSVAGRVLSQAAAMRLRAPSPQSAAQRHRLRAQYFGATRDVTVAPLFGAAATGDAPEVAPAQPSRPSRARRAKKSDNRRANLARRAAEADDAGTETLLGGTAAAQTAEAEADGEDDASRPNSVGGARRGEKRRRDSPPPRWQ